MNEGEESASGLFEAHSDSAMVVDLHEKAFDKMPFFVVIEIGVGPADIILDREKGGDYVHKGAKGKGTCNV